ncbi:MAG: AGE family epimerase/isomerase [Bacteroidetes bacterium]|nr:AGE family epimerase/isomerase [Bacteroidota bacterium]
MNSLQQYHDEVSSELHSILRFWMKFAPDKMNGGFVGKIDNANNIDSTAPKGAVLNGRILWTFSAAYNQFHDEKYLQTATLAFEYIRQYFFDKQYGGVFWTVDANGNMLDSKKQIYAQAFCLYGLSEYSFVTKNEEPLQLSIALFEVIEHRSYDPVNKGYFEAYNRDWSLAADLRLSAKDANEKKTMNTHLHIIEAYANLYKVLPVPALKNKIIELLGLFDKYFINKKTFHLKLFFDENWNEKPGPVSFGHDIEAAWLLLQCAEIINDETWIKIYRNHAISITDAAMEGLDADGGLWYESFPGQQQSEKILIKEKHWWPQAEAMVGLYNAYQLSNDEKYLKASMQCWQFIQQHIIDKNKGEWFWGVNEDYSVMNDEDKAGLWKCPYHNSRACLEIIQRIFINLT